MKRAIFVLTAACFTAACASTWETRSGMSRGDFDRDHAACERENPASGKNTGGGGGTMNQEMGLVFFQTIAEIFTIGQGVETCMRAKGWRKQDD
jgi:hypothetical protein